MLGQHLDSRMLWEREGATYIFVLKKTVAAWVADLATN